MNVSPIAVQRYVLFLTKSTISHYLPPDSLAQPSKVPASLPLHRFDKKLSQVRQTFIKPTIILFGSNY